MPSILLVDDDPVQHRLLNRLLETKLNYRVINTYSGRDAIAQIRKSNIDAIHVVLLDLHMPEMDGFEVLKTLRTLRPDLPVIVLTGSNDTESAVKAIKDGASDFLVKTPAPEQLDITIKNAIRVSTLARELHKLKRDKEGALSFGDIIGSQGGMTDAIALGRKAAATTVPVLITGESGVGKELFARALHGESKRVGAPFIMVNCNAVTEHTADAILFSSDKSACRRAEGGTLFLDDICSLPQDAQISLLQLLQHKEIMSSQQQKPLKVDVRIIAATEKDMAREIKSRRFREDLYFRLNILPVAIPPLRERKDDILPIAHYFAERLSATEGLLPRKFDKSAHHYLLHQQWHGNVRELENLIHRTLVLSEEETINEKIFRQIHLACAPPAITERRQLPELHISLKRPNGSMKHLADIEQEAMRMALSQCQGNVAQAAEELGMAKSTFYRKLKDTK